MRLFSDPRDQPPWRFHEREGQPQAPSSRNILISFRSRGSVVIAFVERLTLRIFHDIRQHCPFGSILSFNLRIRTGPRDADHVEPRVPFIASLRQAVQREDLISISRADPVFLGEIDHDLNILRSAAPISPAVERMNPPFLPTVSMSVLQ